jgi:hypothetical protein
MSVSSRRRPSARRFRVYSTGNHKAEGCQHERERTEDEVVPTALRGKVRNRADRHRDGKEPHAPAEHSCMATRTPDDARAAVHDQRRGDVEDGGDRASAARGSREIRLFTTPRGVSPGDTSGECSLEDGEADRRRRRSRARRTTSRGPSAPIVPSPDAPLHRQTARPPTRESVPTYLPHPPPSSPS